MAFSPPSGITPPAPGLEREEPEAGYEDDIPSDGKDVDAALIDSDAERPPREVERE